MEVQEGDFLVVLCNHFLPVSLKMEEDLIFGAFQAFSNNQSVRRMRVFNRCSQRFS